MCGIAGLWNLNADITAMMDTIKHRGPDDEGCYKNGNVALGIKRLSVIDLETGAQPIYNNDKSKVIVFNGEIFNYIEIYNELKDEFHFKTKSDTEVILRAYEKYGTDCLKYFNGMFAFCIYDGEKFFIARDRLGEKPLYYYSDGVSFAFASEIKALAKVIKLEPVVTEELFCYEASVLENTLFKNVKKLLPAHYLNFDGSKIKIEQYWQLKRNDEDYNEDSYYIEKCRWLVEDSIRLRMRADVPIGAFLSGGLDSSIICMVAKPEKVYSIHYPLGEEFEEIVYAKIVAEKIGAEHIIVQPTFNDLKNNLKKIIWHLDEPIATASPISEFMLAERASKDVKVVLGGQGADELFGGYVRYLVLMEEKRITEKEIFANYISLFKHSMGKHLFGNWAERYFHLVKRADVKSGEIFKRFKAIFQYQKHFIDQVGYTDLFYFLPSLITMNDRASSAYGIENRTPFLDYRIAELAFQLPEHLKVNGYVTKYILREAFKDILPESISKRKDKKGLNTPVNYWFNNSLKSWKDNILKDYYKRTNVKEDKNSSRGMYDRSIYNLVCLELWNNIFFDNN